VISAAEVAESSRNGAGSDDDEDDEDGEETTRLVGVCIGSVAQWLGRRSLAGGLSLPCA